MTLLVTDHGPVTLCCGCWPTARTPFADGYLRRRMVATVAELDYLLALPWVAVHCTPCGKRIEP